MSSLSSYGNKIYKTPGVVIIAGTFQTDGTSAPDVLIGGGWSVAYTDVGKYTVTLDESFHRCIAVVATIGESGDDNDFQVHVEEIDRTASFNSFVLYTTSGGTDTDTDNQQVNFICFAANTTIVNERSS